MYKCSDCFMVRIANLPLDTKNTIDFDDPDAIFKFYETQPKFQEAIAIASPSLYKSLKKGSSTKDKKQLAFSLIKYILRMTSRTTPFGLFSSVALGSFESTTFLDIETEKMKKKVWFDSGVITKIQKLLTSPLVDKNLLYVMRNPQLIYSEQRVFLYGNNDANNTHRSIKKTEFLLILLEISKHSIKYQDLKRKISELFPKTGIDQIENYLKILIDKRFLITEFEDFFQIKHSPEILIKKLQKIDKESSVLFEASKQLKMYEKGAKICLYQLRKNLIGWQENTTNALHIDSYYPKTKFTLSKNVQTSLCNAVSAFIGCFSKDHLKDTKENFKHFFIEKFGLHKACSLGELLPWIRPHLIEAEKTLKKNSLMNLCLSELQGKEIDLKKIISKSPEFFHNSEESLPSIDALFELQASSVKEVDQGNFQIYLKGLTSFLGATMGRFCYLWDKQKVDQLRVTLNQNSEMLSPLIPVEIEPYPEQMHQMSIGIGARLRRFRLPLYYHKPSPDTLSLDDIIIKALPDRVCAYSKSLKRELHFVVGTAISIRSLPLTIRFLLFLSSYQVNPISLLTDTALVENTYMPQIKYENVILSQEKWLIDYSTLNITKIVNLDEIQHAFEKKLNKCNIFGKFTLSFFDNVLHLDRNIKSHMTIASAELMKNKKLVLSRALINPHHNLIKDGNNKFASEFVVPLVFSGRKKKLIPEKNFSASTSIATSAIFPGDEWLFMKLFFPEEQVNFILKNHIFLFMDKLKLKYPILKWFYINYQEENFHLRLRIKALPCLWEKGLFFEVQNYMKQLFKKEIIQDMQICLYEREVERYGGPDAINAAEKVFYADSIYCKKILSHSEWSLPLPFIVSFSILNILYAFAPNNESAKKQLLSPPEKKHYLAGIRSFSKQAQKYAIFLFTQSDDFYPDQHELIILQKALHEQKKALVCFAKVIEQIESNGSLSCTKKEVINSLIHMHCNRLLGIRHNLEEKARILTQYLLEKRSFNHHLTLNQLQKSTNL